MTAWHTLELAEQLVPKFLVEVGRLEAEGAEEAILNRMIFSRISFATLSCLSVSRLTAAFIVGG